MIYSRRFELISAVMLMASANVALADGRDAAVSVKDAPISASASWSGPYIGLHAGYGFTKFGGAYDEIGDHSRNLQDPPVSGFLGGVHSGWNWRAGGWVYGFEADYTAANQGYSFIDDDGDTQKGRISSLASLRGRLGIASGQTMVYVTGGLALGRASFEAIETFAGRGKRTVTAAGGVIGGGIEWMIAPNVSFRGEYLRYLFNKKADITSLTGDSDTQDRFEFRDNSVLRVGLNMMLGGRQAEHHASVTPAANWAGPYLGVHGGYGFTKLGGTYDEIGDLPSNLQDQKLNGFVGGVQGGWNWTSGALVLGVEGDYSASNQRFSFIDADADNQKGRISTLASIRARAGLSTGNAMVYVTGGLAYGRASFEAIESPVDRGKRDVSAVGTVLGGGIEWMVAPNVSMRGEYLHYRFNKKADITALTGDSDPQDRLEFRDNNVIRFGVNVRLPAH